MSSNNLKQSALRFSKVREVKENKKDSKQVLKIDEFLIKKPMDLMDTVSSIVLDSDIKKNTDLGIKEEDGIEKEILHSLDSDALRVMNILSQKLDEQSNHDFLPEYVGIASGEIKHEPLQVLNLPHEDSLKAIIATNIADLVKCFTRSDRPTGKDRTRVVAALETLDNNQFIIKRTVKDSNGNRSYRFYKDKFIWWDRNWESNENSSTKKEMLDTESNIIKNKKNTDLIYLNPVFRSGLSESNYRYVNIPISLDSTIQEAYPLRVKAPAEIYVFVHNLYIYKARNKNAIRFEIKEDNFNNKFGKNKNITRAKKEIENALKTFSNLPNTISKIDKVKNKKGESVYHFYLNIKDNN